MNTNKTERSVNTFLDHLKSIPKKEDMIKYVQHFIQNNAHMINSTQTSISGINHILTSKYFMEAYIENIKIAKTIIFRIKELSQKVDKLKSKYHIKSNNTSQLCTYNDFYSNLIIIEKRIEEYSKMDISYKLSRKISPEWYYDQIQNDIQTLGTLLNMIQLDFMFYNYTERTNTFRDYDLCSNSPNIPLDSTYNESFHKCVDGVCTVLKPYFMNTKSKKKTLKKKRKNE
jgi:hypothetical protein